MLGLCFQKITVQGELRHQIDEGCEKLFGSFGAMTVGLQPGNKRGLIFDPLLRMTDMLSGLLKLYDA
jgi:hypothetical protein